MDKKRCFWALWRRSWDSCQVHVRWAKIKIGESTSFQKILLPAYITYQSGNLRNLIPLLFLFWNILKSIDSDDFRCAYPEIESQLRCTVQVSSHSLVSNIFHQGVGRFRSKSGCFIEPTISKDANNLQVIVDVSGWESGSGYKGGFIFLRGFHIISLCVVLSHSLKIQRNSWTNE